MKITIALRGAVMVNVLVAAQTLKAECGVASLQDQISQEAARIISQQNMKKVEAEAAIDKETAQLLLGRLFDLETGKRLRLPDKLEKQYSIDARYFSETLRAEAAAKRASSEEVFNSIRPCAPERDLESGANGSSVSPPIGVR